MKKKIYKTNKNRIHLLCNAHLDPVWLWQWHEGAGEALSTFRTAVEICEANKTFIFNHNEAILYKWIEEYDPKLFSRIKKLVKEGKWHIMGGWYLQPDCNMPCGESFIRQILKGKTYFRKEFGCDVSTAINFDSFGHSRGLVQILAKCGYDSYIFGRPTAINNLSLPADVFNWVGFDGSKVLATRFEFPYNHPLGQIKEKALNFIDKHKSQQVSILLWGVGNHGGGPSKKDIKDLNNIIENTAEVELLHSTAENYVKDIKAVCSDLPEYSKDLNPWGVGCYSSMSRVKRLHIMLENEIASAEKTATAAWVHGLMDYPKQQLDEAIENLLFSEFHDALPGTSIEPVEFDLINRLGRGLDLVDKIRTRGFFALTKNLKPAKNDSIPVVVYNHNPYDIDEVVSCEFNLATQLDRQDICGLEIYDGSKIIDSQFEREASTVPMQWRKKVVFRAKIKAGQAKRFDCHIKVLGGKPSKKMLSRGRYIKLDNERLELKIDTKTGLVDTYKVDGINYFKKGAFEPLAIKDNSDSWGMLNDSFRDVAGKFTLMSETKAAEFAAVDGQLSPVRIIEDGAVRTIVEALFEYEGSCICQRYIIPKQGTEIEVECVVHWNHKDTMLKMQVPFVSKNFAYFGQTAFGTQQLPTDGRELVSQRWNAVVFKDKDIAATLINNCTYGSDIVDNNMRITMLRSPGYATHPSSLKREIYTSKDRYTMRMDQGVHKFNFWFDGCKTKDSLEAIERQSQIKNEKLFTLAYFPQGNGKCPKPLIKLSNTKVVMTTMKQSEDGRQIIIRLFEPTGKERTTKLMLPAFNIHHSIKLSAFEVKTLAVNLKDKSITETNMLEE